MFSVLQQSLRPELSFFLPQDNVNEATDERERESQPGQDEGVSVSIILIFPLWTHHRINDGPAHHKQTGEDLEDGCEKEATSLYKSEELAEEDDEGDQAENGG